MLCLGADLPALVAMLREEGFARVDGVHRERRAYRYARAALRRLRAQQGRVALHARRLS